MFTYSLVTHAISITNRVVAHICPVIISTRSVGHLISSLVKHTDSVLSTKNIFNHERGTAAADVIDLRIQSNLCVHRSSNCIVNSELCEVG